MVENTYVDEFREKEYREASQEFWAAAGQRIMDRPETIVNLVKETFAEVFEKTAELQELGADAAGQIAVSLLHVSVWDGSFRARIDVYDKDQVTGILLYSADMDVSWLFTEWDAFFENLRRLAGEKGVRRYLKDPVLRQMMETEISQMAVYLCGLLKYILKDADRFAQFERLKRNPRFYISVGEYQDWQRALYVELPEVDILNPPEGYPLLWQRVKDRKFKGQCFSDLDLSKARFFRCEFVHCTFERVNLNDVRFTECTFRNVELLSGTMYGTAFLDSKLTNVDYSGMRTKWKPFDGTSEEDEIYRDFLMDNCETTDVKGGEEQ